MDAETDGATHVVGVVASAGGLDALTRVVREMEPDGRLCVVVAQHMAPDRDSLMATLLQRETQVPVEELQDGAPVRPDRIYVVPPNTDAVLRNGTFQLVAAEDRPGVPKPSGDRLLKSIATEAGEKAIAVILSGTGSDGAYGIQAVREAGGAVISQDLGTAKHDSMPAAAIETGCVDLVLEPQAIAGHLDRIVAGDRNFDILQSDSVETPLDELMTVLLARTRIDFRDYKEGTFRRRLQRRMQARGTDSVDDYIACCRESEQETRALYRDLLISVTRFFRDPHEFFLLRETLAERIEAMRDRPIRVWVAG